MNADVLLREGVYDYSLFHYQRAVEKSAWVSTYIGCKPSKRGIFGISKKINITVNDSIMGGQ